MTATSHRIFNLSAAIALSFHWWVWLLFLLAASLPDQLEPATRKQSRFRSHRGLFHTYSVWILLGLTIFWLPTRSLTVSGIPVFNAGVKVLVWIYLAGVLCHLVADTGSRQGCSILLPCNCGQLGTAAATGIRVGYRSSGIGRENSLRQSVSSCSVVSAPRSPPGGGKTIWILLN
jgi:LexA-binding, inner membrane-associated putative hydrolase